jgi:hypothetical protein
MDPVAQSLAVHAADLRRRASVHPVPDRRQRQKPPALVDVLRTTGKPPQLLGRMSSRNLTAAGMAQILHATLNLPSRNSGIPPMSQPVGPLVISALFRPQTQRFPQADNALGGNRYSPTARETREIWRLYIRNQDIRRSKYRRL